MLQTLSLKLWTKKTRRKKSRKLSSSRSRSRPSRRRKLRASCAVHLTWSTRLQSSRLTTMSMRLRCSPSMRKSKNSKSALTFRLLLSCKSELNRMQLRLSKRLTCQPVSFSHPRPETLISSMLRVMTTRLDTPWKQPMVLNETYDYLDCVD